MLVVPYYSRRRGTPKGQDKVRKRRQEEPGRRISVGRVVRLRHGRIGDSGPDV